MARGTMSAAALTLVAALAVLPPSAAADSTALVAAKACRKQISLQGRSYAKKRLGYVLGCVDKILKCELLQEIDGINASSCRGSATDSCRGKIGPATDSSLSKAAARFDDKSGLTCLAMMYADVLSNGAGGLWYTNDGTCAAAVDLPSMLDCVRGEVEARVDALAAEVKPRAGLLLDNIGLGGGFPNLTRPPFADQVVAATAVDSGVLVNPGTIVLPAGTALRVTGDPTTLPCGSGSGMNGKLTVRIGASGMNQEFQLREPYGPGEFAIFGPYTTPATIPYTIELKDGSCMDSTSGDVSVP
ncbi:MAG: hypothetical protein ACREQL_06330 [Candidatus Binatia bacterium]